MQLVISYKKHASTTSRLIAQKFEKRHSDVLRAIENLECSKDFNERNFALVDYTDAKGEKRKEYIITRDGFVFLVMGFTGEQAGKFKEEYLEEFNRMEAILQQGSTPVLIPTYQQRILSEPTKTCPTDNWCVFDESHSIMLFVEKHIGSVNKYDLVDGSIGYHWSKYRQTKAWAKVTNTYLHEYDDNRGKRECKCYHMDELVYFREWLKNTYKNRLLHPYLQSKYQGEKNVVMLDKVNEVLPKLLKKGA